MEYKILKKMEFPYWIERFCDLYQKCFSGTINTNIVRWRYLDNPLGELIVCVAIDNNRLVGVSAALPCEIVYNDKIEESAISLNLMTDPEFRGKGVFVKLASKLYEYMENQGYKSVLGFPNYISNPTFTSKLGRVVIYEIPTLKLSLSDFRNNLESRSWIIDDDAFELNYCPITHKSKSIYIKKDKEYFKWRYYKNPQNKYKNFVVVNESNVVKSFLICKEYNEQLNIVDYYFAEEKDINPLIERSIEYARDLGKVSITTWSQIGTEEHLILQKLGFRNNYPVTYFSGKLFGTIDKSDDFYDYRKWHITMGDDHVY